MKTSDSSTAEDLISDYVDGRWDRIDSLLQQHLQMAITEDCRSVLALLSDLSPARMLTSRSGMSLSGPEGLAPAPQMLIASCRGQLLAALSAVSLGDSDQALAATSAFCASLSSLLEAAVPELIRARVVLRLAGPARLHQSLRLFQFGRLHRLAGDLPTRMTVVLGMHRSGTSALSGMLEAAGLKAPSDVLGASSGNPTGYWESRRLVGLTDRFLTTRMGCSWAQLFRAPPCWDQHAMALTWVSQHLDGMAQCFETRDHIVLKDPRLCLLLSPLCPAWHAGGLGVDYLLILRSPIEVVASLTEIHPISALDALCLWIASVLNSERLTRYLPRRLISFPDLLAEPQEVLSRCRSMWGTSADAKNDHSALAMIDVSLHRQRSLDVKERILADSTQLFELLEFADLVYETVLHADQPDSSEHLDGLYQVWDWKRAELFQSAGA